MIPSRGGLFSALFDEIFENPDFGAFVFKRDQSGDVSGFVLQSGRVLNLFFNKTD